jgi:hypothetical protein
MAGGERPWQETSAETHEPCWAQAARAKRHLLFWNGEIGSGSRGDWYVGNFREGRIEGIMINRNFYSENYFDFPHTAIKLLRRLGVSETFFHGI